MYYLQIETDFSAAHNLRGYEGRCENLHGHNYRIVVEVRGERLNALGMLIDFKELKRICEGVVGGLDHDYLNDIEPFDSLNPTAENIASHIFRGIGGELPDGVSVGSVTCWESDRCAARYSEHDEW